MAKIIAFDQEARDAIRRGVGKLAQAVKVTLEEYRQRIAARLVAQAPDLEAFRQCWIEPEARRGQSPARARPANRRLARVSRLLDGRASACFRRFWIDWVSRWLPYYLDITI